LYPHFVKCATFLYPKRS